MSTTLLDENHTSVSPAQWLRETTAAVRVSFVDDETITKCHLAGPGRSVLQLLALQFRK